MKYSYKLVISIVFIIGIWTWNRYGNFQEIIKQYGVDGLQIGLIIFCLYALIALRKANFILLGLTVLIMLVPLLNYFDFVSPDQRFLIAYPIFSGLFVYYLIDYDKKKQEEST